MSQKLLKRAAASLLSLAMFASMVPGAVFAAPLAEEASPSAAETATVPTVEVSPAPETTPAAEATPAPEATPDAEATPVPETTPAAETTPVPEATPDTEATPVPEATPDTEATPMPETTPDTEATPVPEATPAADSVPASNSASSAAALSDSGYSFDQMEDIYILVEKGWTFNVWESLPEPSKVRQLSGSSIASYSALGSNNSTLASVDRTNYLSVTIKGSAGRTFTLTGQRYKITNADGSVTYATWDHKPAEGSDYVVEECEWQLKISNHLYSTDPADGVVTKEPTCTEAGERTFTCQLCHEKDQVESIPALHSSLGSGEACPDCGMVLYTWDEATKTLTFTADIPNYTQSNYATERPYQEYADQAQRVVIGENVTQIGSYAFAYFTAMTAVGPADTPDKTGILDVTNIGYAAFWNDHGISEYTFTDAVADMDGCLYNCGTLDKVTVHSTPVTDSFGFQANEPIDGSTMVTQMIIDDPDGTLGKINISSRWDGILNLTVNVGKICGSATSEDLKTLTVTNAESIDARWLYDSWGQGSSVPALTDVTLENVGIVGDSAFNGTGVQNVTLKNVSALQENVFYNCRSLSNVSIENVGLIDAYVFDNCTSLTKLDVPEETKLGYSNIFDFSNPNFAYLQTRMLGILDGEFALDENPNPQELTVPAGWESSKIGTENAAELDKTQVTKAARWADADRTAADVEFQFNYAKKQGMDFVFVIDYSGSMSKVGNYADGTTPDDSVDNNSRFFDMQSKLLDVSEQLLNTPGYDNRVSFITFSTNESYLHTQDFTGDYATAENFVLEYQPYGSTNYALALSKAYDLISSRTDTSREAAVIFISDGQPNKFLDGTANRPPEYAGESSTWNAVVAQINDYADKIKNLQQFGHGTKIFGVLQSIPSSDETRCQQVMEGVATDGLFFKSSDTASFSTAINNAIGAAFNVYTLTDEIDPAFTLDESSIQASVGTYTVETSADGNQKITWTISGVPYTTHTLTYRLNLKPNADGTMPNGVFDTNEGDAAITQNSAAVNAVATPSLSRGTLLLQPADMTIYMGGEEGYSGVVTEDGVITESGSDSLPQPGFYVTLPSDLDQKMKEIWADSGDVSVIENSDGSTTQVLNLSNYLRLKDEKAGKEWTLSLYSSGYSLAYAKYIYRIEPLEDGMDPIRLQFIDEDGNFHTSDTFTLSDALYQNYTMQAYNEAVLAGDVVAQLRTGTDTWTSLPLSLSDGTLTIRYVTGSQEATVTPAVSDIAQAAPTENTALEHASVVVDDQTLFYINGSHIPADNANVSLLFDNVVSDTTQGSQGDYAQILNDIALTKLDTELTAPQYETKYLDLVDADNGNVWLTASAPVTVYWPYPEGTNADTQFYLVHFKGLDRNMEQADLKALLSAAEAERVAVSTDVYGISFRTDSFSPFVLMWDNEEETGSSGGSTSSSNNGTAQGQLATGAGTTAAAAQTTQAAIPQTGDSMDLTLWFTLTASSGLGLVWATRKKRRTQR